MASLNVFCNGYWEQTIARIGRFQELLPGTRMSY